MLGRPARVHTTLTLFRIKFYKACQVLGTLWRDKTDSYARLLELMILRSSEKGEHSVDRGSQRRLPGGSGAGSRGDTSQPQHLAEGL